MFLQNFDWKRHKPLCKTVQSQLAKSTTVVATTEQSTAKLINPVGHATVDDVKWLGTLMFLD